MSSTILITGSTGGLGFETARHLASLGHQIVLHGRDPGRLQKARRAVEMVRTGSVVATVVADLSHLGDIDELVRAATEARIDVLINNAGVLATDDPLTGDGLDVRFVTNAIAPYVLTQRIRAALPTLARVVNLSSAAQAPVDLDALAGRPRLGAGSAYAQSKLALTMWSRHLGETLGADGPVIVAVNPGSYLATNMVAKAYGITGNNIRIGVDILTRAALSDDFATATGRYYDNDGHRFAQPHPDALNPARTAAVVAAIEQVAARLTTG